MNFSLSPMLLLFTFLLLASSPINCGDTTEDLLGAAVVGAAAGATSLTVDTVGGAVGKALAPGAGGGKGSKVGFDLVKIIKAALAKKADTGLGKKADALEKKFGFDLAKKIKDAIDKKFGSSLGEKIKNALDKKFGKKSLGEKVKDALSLDKISKSLGEKVKDALDKKITDALEKKFGKDLGKKIKDALDKKFGIDLDKKFGVSLGDKIKDVLDKKFGIDLEKKFGIDLGDKIKKAIDKKFGLDLDKKFGDLGKKIKDGLKKIFEKDIGQKIKDALNKKFGIDLGKKIKDGLQKIFGKDIGKKINDALKKKVKVGKALAIIKGLIIIKKKFGLLIGKKLKKLGKRDVSTQEQFQFVDNALELANQLDSGECIAKMLCHLETMPDTSLSPAALTLKEALGNVNKNDYLNTKSSHGVYGLATAVGASLGNNNASTCDLVFQTCSLDNNELIDMLDSTFT